VVPKFFREVRQALQGANYRVDIGWWCTPRTAKQSPDAKVCE
jgi:hypothetical protein